MRPQVLLGAAELKSRFVNQSGHAVLGAQPLQTQARLCYFHPRPPRNSRRYLRTRLSLIYSAWAFDTPDFGMLFSQDDNGCVRMCEMVPLPGGNQPG